METFQFQKATAVWVPGREKERNCELAFRALLPGGDICLYLAASTIFRIRANGRFVSAGPARAAHGYYRVDRIELAEWLTEQENVIVIEVVGYNVNTYDTLEQPAFLTAEFIRNGEVLCCTGDDRFRAYDLRQRVQKVQRYSFQRAFAECYHLEAEKAGFYTQANWEGLAEYEQSLAVTASAAKPEKNYLKRDVRVPEYERLQVQALLESGQAEFLPVSPGQVQRWETKKGMTGYKAEELEAHLADEARSISLTPSVTKSEGEGRILTENARGHKSENTSLRLPEDTPLHLSEDTSLHLSEDTPLHLPEDTSWYLPENGFPLFLENAYGLYCFPFNATGFLRADIKCEKPCTVYLMFDEILENGKLDCMRMTSVNCFRYTLDPGKHAIMTFAPYTMKYVQVVVKGQAEVKNIDMVEYKHPPAAYGVRLPEDDTLRLIYRAALESYLSNAVDIFTDCPSRERAGWLCDSFFTARVEHVLMGESVLEKAFLENFLLPERFEHLPEGMLPMCYPADHADGSFIPNWAMWFVLELEEYLERSGDRELVDRARERLYALTAYFEAFENEYGLLENLESWVFVEWSRANDADVVQDVNFPSNMLYMRMLEAMAALYADGRLREKARRLRKVIRERSFNGSFYTDNEKRVGQVLENPGNCTEVCQYYAFFTGVADRDEDSGLWEVLERDFGPRRKQTGKYPEVAYANAFIGNYLRIELLYRNGQYEEVLDNIRGYFAFMAERTGTLWEFDSPRASCNHGFASHVIYWLAGIYGTVKN